MLLMRKKIMSTTPESTKPGNCQSVSCCSAAACATTTLSEQDVTQTRSDQPQNKFRISNMDCASEESEIRRALDGIQGIDALRFDLGARVLTISASEAALQGALQAIRKAGFKPKALKEEGNTSSNASTASPAFGKVWGKLLASTKR